MCINIAIFGLQIANIVLAIRHHNSIAGIVLAFLSLIVRVCPSLPLPASPLGTYICKGRTLLIYLQVYSSCQKVR
jgi:hypothetical protein